MPQMVYIRQIHPLSFLVFSTNQEGFRLRDFSSEGNGPATELMKQSATRTASDIREMASQEGNKLIPVPEEPLSDYGYWHEQTVRLNEQYLKPAGTVPASAEPESRSWVREIVVGVVVAIVAAVILAWLGLKN